MEHERPDFLAGFHLQNPDHKACALIAHLIIILEQQKSAVDRETLQHNIANLLDDAASLHILHLVCQKMHIDYLELMQECQKLIAKHITPHLLLHIICLPISYVANKLEVDSYQATQLLDKLRNVFTIDDPILWLKRLVDLTEQERLRYSKKKEDLLHGLAVTDQPVDTAEERKIRERHIPARPKLPMDTD